ncbi:hypothetical protein EV651_11280 [Kribbella sp. VKM Ac-2571]|nr:hypothetical protein EV651_11280 [Kribbella sp. VKM Ac-2571]
MANMSALRRTAIVAGVFCPAIEVAAIRALLGGVDHTALLGGSS